MKRLSRALVVAVCLAVLPGCNLINPKQKTLTDEQVVKYIQAYNNIRKSVSNNMAKQIRQDANGGNPGMPGFSQVEGAVKQAGFKDYAEFVRVNSAVAWAFSQGEGKAFMDDMDAEHKKAYAEIEAKLKDPNVPEAVKAQLRQSEADLKANYAKNKPWADVSMNLTSHLTDKESIAVVMRHRKELEAAFSQR
jgi:hypothetical protein